MSSAAAAAAAASRGSWVWVVAASVGAVEALKDQVGFCRWNYGFRSLHQHAKNNMPSLAHASRRHLSSSSSIERTRKEQQSEEALRKVMYLSCWGLN
ncbi:Uncharacterized protein M6B38_219190 [Iris pallida]|uniref:Wound-induced protein n=1 Tax=Iris pallida TaxID=29817 RepID=A0AAX6DXR1_IRIPA|nr:Uncharacterized protein M6B38_219190 [Iris pallida]